MITKGGSRTFQTSGGGGGGGGQTNPLYLINSTRVLGMECGEAYLPTVTLLQFHYETVLTMKSANIV